MRNDLHANLTVRIFTDRKCFGTRAWRSAAPCARAALAAGAAAMSMNMAYSKAWTVLRTAQEGLGSSCSGYLHRRAERWRRDADGGGRAAAPPTRTTARS